MNLYIISALCALGATTLLLSTHHHTTSPPCPPALPMCIYTHVRVRAFSFSHSHASYNPHSSLRLLQMALFVVITRKKSNHTWTLSNYPLAHIPTGARSRWVCSSTWPSLPCSFHLRACTGALASAGYLSFLRRDTQNTYPPCLTHMHRSG